MAEVVKSQQQTALESWTRRISDEEMAVFAHTTRSISAASSSDDTPTAELAHLILRDSTMTTRILRLANSVYYNPSGQPVNTISRAIVFLGFAVVRTMALTITILEPMLKGVQREYVLEEMAKSFHAAIQARGISQARGNEDPEEVFVAALLNRIGNMTFWCFAGDKAKELDLAYLEWENAEDAERDVLGFTLKELSVSLNNEWNLSSLLKDCFDNPESTDVLNTDVMNSIMLIDAIDEGWGSINTKNAIKRISEQIHKSFDETEVLVFRGANEAAKTATEYGLGSAGKLIPAPKKSTAEYDDANEETVKHCGDVSLQISILRELTSMLHERVEINAILGAISEGIFRALGMERTVIAFVSPNDQRLSAKYLLGDDKGKLNKCFNFQVGPNHKNIFSEALKGKDAYWINSETRLLYDPVLTKEIKQCLGVLDFFCMPIRIGNTGKGIIYADCKLSGRELTREEFETFSHFSGHATLAFDLMSRK